MANKQDESSEPTLGDIAQSIARLEKNMATKTDVSELGVEISDVKSDVTELKSDVTELKSDVTELKSDVTELKSDVTELKTDVSELKTDMLGARSDILQLEETIKHEASDLGDSINSLTNMVAKEFDSLAIVRLNQGHKKTVRPRTA